MSGVVIRFADPARDAARILGVYRPYIEQTAITFDWDVPSEADFARRVRGIADAFPVLLLEVDGELAGFAYAHGMSDKAAFDWNAELTVYMDMSRRGLGLGRPLYALLIRLLERQGYVNLYAVITGSNAESIEMHERMGFVLDAVHARTGYKFGAWHDTVWMRKRLREGAPGKIVPVGALDPEDVAREILSAQEEAARRLESRVRMRGDAGRDNLESVT